jgi:hypothetical protein
MRDAPGAQFPRSATPDNRLLRASASEPVHLLDQLASGILDRHGDLPILTGNLPETTIAIIFSFRVGSRSIAHSRFQA